MTRQIIRLEVEVPDIDRLANVLLETDDLAFIEVKPSDQHRGFGIADFASISISGIADVGGSVALSILSSWLYDRFKKAHVSRVFSAGKFQTISPSVIEAVLKSQ